MRLEDIIDRQVEPEPTDPVSVFPWTDLRFSQRMLSSHISQEHDGGSRRLETIKAQVGWIHETILHSGVPQNSRVLDLGCGPGFYTNGLAGLGHECLGIDCSPAAVEYAQATGLPGATFIQADIRTAAYGRDYDLAMLIYSDFNLFKAEEAGELLGQVRESLRPGGQLLLEGWTEAAIRSMVSSKGWKARKASLWSDLPHLCLQECHWNKVLGSAVCRYYVVDAASADVEELCLIYKVYSNADYQSGLERAGFRLSAVLDGLGGAPPQEGFVAFLAARA